MADFGIGYLFKTKCFYGKYVVFELVDCVVGICFKNAIGERKCQVITGKYANITVNYFDKNANDDNQFYFFEKSLDTAIKNNGYSVEYDKIVKDMIKGMSKYSMKKGDYLYQITDEKTIKDFEQAFHSKKEFNEQDLSSRNDISTMYNDIKKTIIAQDEQIMQILTALFKNQTVINSNLDTDLIAKLKENVLICGSTGTGKTEILKRISKLYDIPIVIEDATSLSETGYVGRKITDLLEDLYLSADGDIEKAQKGILVIDEFDKLAEGHTNSGDHVSRIGVQRSLLKLLDGSLFYFDDKKFDTSKLTVVALGAFTGIKQGDDYANLTNDDFIKYGMMRELMGRFSKIIKMNTLTEEDIIKILKESDFSPLNTYKVLFEKLGIEYSYTEDFIQYIAEIAVTKQSGARSLKMVFDDAISGALFKIFAGEYTSISLERPSSENDKPYTLTDKNSSDKKDSDKPQNRILGLFKKQN